MELGAPSAADFIPTQAELVTSDARSGPSVLERSQPPGEATPLRRRPRPRPSCCADRVTVTQVRAHPSAGHRALDRFRSEAGRRHRQHHRQAATWSPTREKRLGVSQGGPGPAPRTTGPTSSARRCSRSQRPAMQAIPHHQQRHLLRQRPAPGGGPHARHQRKPLAGGSRSAWRSPPRSGRRGRRHARRGGLDRHPPGRPVQSASSPACWSNWPSSVRLGGRTAVPPRARTTPSSKAVDVQRQALQAPRWGILSIVHPRLPPPGPPASPRMEGQLLRESHARAGIRDRTLQPPSPPTTNCSEPEQGFAASDALSRIIRRIDRPRLDSMISGQGDNVTRELEVRAEPPVDKFSPAARQEHPDLDRWSLAVFLVRRRLLLPGLHGHLRPERGRIAAPLCRAASWAPCRPITKARDGAKRPTSTLIASNRPPPSHRRGLPPPALLPASRPAEASLPRAASPSPAAMPERRQVASPPSTSPSPTRPPVARSSSSTPTSASPACTPRFSLERCARPQRPPLRRHSPSPASASCVQGTRFEGAGVSSRPAPPPASPPSCSTRPPSANSACCSMLTGAYDLVLFDTPPSAQLVDAILISRARPTACSSSSA
jgi:hypothetical protein